MSHELITQWAGVGGTIFFVLLFIGVLIYALNPYAKETFTKAAHMPLEEDDRHD